MDTRWSKGESESKDHLEKDCRKRERQGGVEELKCGQGSGTQRGGLVGQCDSLMCLPAQRVMMMMMMMTWMNKAQPLNSPSSNYTEDK